MDIEKLKAEFEQSECFKRLEHVAQYTFFEFGAYIKRTDVPADIEKKCGKLITALLFSWSAWKEARTQADQKIKLLLCDEHLKKCESPTGVFNSQYPDEEPCLICLAKETKAQAVPDLGELQERIAGHQYYHDEHGHMIVDMDDVVKEISGFDSWQAQAVPEGFILVPKEPTEAMIQRGTKANSECLNENAPLGERLFRHPALQVYQAMVNRSGE